MKKWLHITECATVLSMNADRAQELLSRHKVLRIQGDNGYVWGHSYDAAQVYGLKTFLEFQATQARELAQKGGGE